MRYFKEDFLKIVRNERGVLAVMVLNTLLAIALIVSSVTHLNPESSHIKISYGDIVGYRDGAWFDIFTYILLAIIFGSLHNLLALRIYHKRGSGMTKLFLIITTILILDAFLVFFRLFGEN